MITRGDLLRVAVSMMKDYQNKTCVGNYLRDIQKQAKSWPKYRPSKKMHHYICTIMQKNMVESFILSLIKWKTGILWQQKVIMVRI